MDSNETKYVIANSVFLELAKLPEQTKIQVNKDTPVFTVIEPVTIPTQRSKPNRPMILFGWIIFSSIIGIGIVYGKQFIASIKPKLIDNQ